MPQINSLFFVTSVIIYLRVRVSEGSLKLLVTRTVGLLCCEYKERRVYENLGKYNHNECTERKNLKISCIP